MGAVPHASFSSVPLWHSGDRAPASQRRAFESADLPATSDGCEAEAARLRCRAELLDDVEPGVVREYRELARSLQDLEQQSRDHERRAQQQREDIQDVKDRWVVVERKARKIERS